MKRIVLKRFDGRGSDLLGFIQNPGEDPIAAVGIEKHVAFMHVTSAPPPPFAKTTGEIIAHHKRFTAKVRPQKNLRLVRSKTELEDRNTVGLICGIQYPPEKPRDVKKLRRHGIFVTTIAYNHGNGYGGGWLEPKHELTEAGKEFLRACADTGMILDLAHAGHTTARGALEYIAYQKLPLPVMVSHTGCYNVYPSYRNLPDDVLEMVAARRGIVGIAALTFILDKEANDLVPFFRHIEHALKVCGPNGIAIGSDGPYAPIDEGQARDKVLELQAALDPNGALGVRYPAYPSELNRTDRLQVIWQKLDWLIDAIRRKVFKRNVLEFFQRALPA